MNPGKNKFFDIYQKISDFHGKVNSDSVWHVKDSFLPRGPHIRLTLMFDYSDEVSGFSITATFPHVNVRTPLGF